MLEARQALDDAAERERAAFVADGADAKLAKRICVEHTEDGIVLRVRSPHGIVGVQTCDVRALNHTRDTPQA